MSGKNSKSGGKGSPSSGDYRKRTVDRAQNKYVPGQSKPRHETKAEQQAKAASAKAAEDRARLIRTITKLFIAMLVVMLIALAWRNRVEWSCANVRQCLRDASVDVEAGEGFPVTISGSRAVSMDELSGSIAVLSDNMFLIYGSGSGEVASASHYMSSPALKTAGRYALVYDIGNKKYRLEAASGTISNGETANSIICGAVSRAGSYCIVQQGSDLNSALLSTVEVFSLSGELLHKWHSTKYYITGAALSSDGSCVALTGVRAENGRLISAVILQSIGSEEELARIVKQDNIYIDLEFTVNDVLFAVGSELVTVVTGFGKSEQSCALNGELVAYDVNYNYGLAVFTADDSGEQSGTLVLYDARGRERCTVDVPLGGLAVSLYDSGCCVLGRGELRVYQNSGELYGSWEVDLGCSDALILGGKAYLLEGLKITQYKLRRSADSETA